MRMQRWNKFESRLMDGEPQFTQAQVDAAAAKAAADATGALQKQLDEQSKLNADLAAKVATFEDGELKGVEKLQKRIEDLGGKLTAAEAENASLAKIRDDWHADLQGRWKGISAKLGENEKTKKVLESGVFKKGDEVEAVQHNLAQYRELVASGLLVQDEATSSPDGKKTTRKDGDPPASAMDKTVNVLRKQFNNE